jgi:hypothetical protein
LVRSDFYVVKHGRPRIINFDAASPAPEPSATAVQELNTPTALNLN